MDNEITVITKSDFKDLVDDLLSKGFIEKDKYQVNDIYMVPKDTDLNDNTLDVLKKCVLVRNIDDRLLRLTYKIKEYDEYENIISQSKTQVSVDSIPNAINFMKSIGYQELIEISDTITVLAKDGLELAVEEVNGKYLFIEIEENDKYPSTESLIKALETLDINYEHDNYFAKKAKIIFEDQYR